MAKTTAAVVLVPDTLKQHPFLAQPRTILDKFHDQSLSIKDLRFRSDRGIYLKLSHQGIDIFENEVITAQHTYVVR